jgi:uracil-DNA glycosylase
MHSSWNSLFEQYDIDLNLIFSPEDTVYPKREDVLKVFELPVDEIQVVLLGQDPYHGPGQAHGLSFSVPDKIKVPPSLVNIFKELNSEFPDRKYNFVSGNLEKWFTREKIFLLNASLTVLKSKPGSHLDLWEEFTDDVIKYISDNNPKCVFMLFGNFAKRKREYIQDKSKIVTAAHPSPFSAHSGFFGSDCFKKTELILKKSIDWQN